MSSFFFFNDTATTEIYTLSLHDALPISSLYNAAFGTGHASAPDLTAADLRAMEARTPSGRSFAFVGPGMQAGYPQDRKSTRLNSSHANISYAVFCLKKKKYYSHISLTLR